MQLQNNRQNFGILIIILGVVVLGAVVYFIFFHDFSKNKIGEQPVVEQALPKNKIHIKEANNIPAENNISVPATNIIDNKVASPFEDARQLASFFTERIGTWSNQASESNLVNLKFFMTKEMKDWADKKIADNSRFVEYKNYYGITTKVISTNILSKQDDKAVIMVMTQRSEEKNKKNRIFNQNMKIELVKVNGKWKVDGAYWQK